MLFALAGPAEAVGSGALPGIAGLLQSEVRLASGCTPALALTMKRAFRAMNERHFWVALRLRQQHVETLDSLFPFPFFLEPSFLLLFSTLPGGFHGKVSLQNPAVLDGCRKRRKPDANSSGHPSSKQAEALLSFERPADRKQLAL